jgi:hypothetical protein
MYLLNVGFVHGEIQYMQYKKKLQLVMLLSHEGNQIEDHEIWLVHIIGIEGQANDGIHLPH